MNLTLNLFLQSISEQKMDIQRTIPNNFYHQLCFEIDIPIIFLQPNIFLIYRYNAHTFSIIQDICRKYNMIVNFLYDFIEEHNFYRIVCLLDQKKC